MIGEWIQAITGSEMRTTYKPERCMTGSYSHLKLQNFRVEYVNGRKGLALFTSILEIER
jgi:hypothetical protein